MVTSYNMQVARVTRSFLGLWRVEASSVWFRGTMQSISGSDDEMDMTRNPGPTTAILVEERVFRFRFSWHGKTCS